MSNNNCKDCIFQPIGNGQAACAGCNIKSAEEPFFNEAPNPKHVVWMGASGCSIVAEAIYPFTSMRNNGVHPIFETTGGALTGMQAAYEWQRSQGLITEDDIRFVAFAGDGATADIGAGSLSGWLDRGDPGMIWVCYDNNHYANTGTQRSGTTPIGTFTTTTPHGFSTSPNAQGKDLIKFAAAHPALAYAAHTTISRNWPYDLEEKARAAHDHAMEGPVFVHVITPCPRGWSYAADRGREIGDIGIDTGAIPLYHVVKVGLGHLWYLDFLPERYEEFWNGGEIRKDIHPVEEWLLSQGRFNDILKNPAEVAAYQERLDFKWRELKKICEPYGS